MTTPPQVHTIDTEATAPTTDQWTHVPFDGRCFIGDSPVLDASKLSSAAMLGRVVHMKVTHCPTEEHLDSSYPSYDWCFNRILLPHAARHSNLHLVHHLVAAQTRGERQQLQDVLKGQCMLRYHRTRVADDEVHVWVQDVFDPTPEFMRTSVSFWDQMIQSMFTDAPLDRARCVASLLGESYGCHALWHERLDALSVPGAAAAGANEMEFIFLLYCRVGTMGTSIASRFQPSRNDSPVPPLSSLPFVPRLHCWVTGPSRRTWSDAAAVAARRGQVFVVGQDQGEVLQFRREQYIY